MTSSWTPSSSRPSGIRTTPPIELECLVTPIDARTDFPLERARCRPSLWGREETLFPPSGRPFTPAPSGPCSKRPRHLGTLRGALSLSGVPPQGLRCRELGAGSWERAAHLRTSRCAVDSHDGIKKARHRRASRRDGIG